MFAFLVSVFLYPWALEKIAWAIKIKHDLEESVGEVVEKLKERLSYDGLYHLFDTQEECIGRVNALEASHISREEILELNKAQQAEIDALKAQMTFQNSLNE